MYGGKTITFLALEDLSAMQYRYVTQETDTTVGMVNAGTDIPVGILQNAPGSGEEAIVQIDGVSKLVMNDAVAVQTFVKVEYVGASDNGKGDAADTAGDLAVGKVLLASGAEDDVGAVQIICTRIHA